MLSGGSQKDDIGGADAGACDIHSPATERYLPVRARSVSLAAPLSAEDQQIQSMPDASPTKWHLAHSTWFFETFVLAQDPAYRPFDPAYAYLFNSYYEAIGPRHPRPQRGLISRPSAAEVMAYRAHVDAAMVALIDHGAGELAPLIELGLHHEEQHQELILMDIKHAFSLSALSPAYAPAPKWERISAGESGWSRFDGGLVEVGYGGTGFAFDNEGPRHRCWIEPFGLADRPVTNGEWAAFIADGGYSTPTLWLSDGWSAVVDQDWDAPLYWRGDTVFTLYGDQPIDPAAPVSHISYYEADAFARWAGRRLPTEVEWEVAARSSPTALEPTGQSLEPIVAKGRGLQQMTGALWQWTASAYAPYPGFRPAADATGEYNGKFMSGQMVLRGGACITPPGHSRPTYRNFFPPSARWPFCGVRLADEA
jgi:ergothioneine biosynthesis protein EgtB